MVGFAEERAAPPYLMLGIRIKIWIFLYNRLIGAGW